MISLLAQEDDLTFQKKIRNSPYGHRVLQKQFSTNDSTKKDPACLHGGPNFWEKIPPDPQLRAWENHPCYLGGGDVKRREKRIKCARKRKKEELWKKIPGAKKGKKWCMGNKYLHTWCGRREENLIFKRGRGAWNTNTSYSASTYVLRYCTDFLSPTFLKQV